MEFNKELLEKNIQEIIDDPEMTLEEKKKIILENKLKEKIMERLQKKDIEVVKLFNEKIFKNYYKNMRELEIESIPNYEELKKRFEEGIVIEEGKILFIIGNKKEINNELKELYRVSNGKDYDKEIEKSKKLINHITKYKSFFVNTKDKVMKYQEILEIYKILFNGVSFKVLKNKVENL